MATHQDTNGGDGSASQELTPHEVEVWIANHAQELDRRDHTLGGPPIREIIRRGVWKDGQVVTKGQLERVISEYSNPPKR